MVTELAKPQNNYASAFQNLRQLTPTMPWVELVRASAMDRFERLGFPTVKEEDWKYTNLAELSRSAFEPRNSAESTLAEGAVSEYCYPETAGSNVVLIDGFLNEPLSSLANLQQIVIVDLFEAIADARYNKTVRQYLARNANYHDSGMTALNTAFIQSGVFILVPKNVKLEVPLQVTFVSTSPNGQSASFPRVLLVAEENSSATVIENYVSLGEESAFTNGVAEVVLKEGARLTHYRLQRENLQSFHVANTSAELGRGSSYDTTSITLGAKLSRHDVSVVMDHEGAECWVDGLYVIGSEQHADTHSLIDHKAPFCTSHQLYKGILDGNGRAVFNGKVFVRHGAQKTDAMQTNKNLLLSNRAHVDTKPQLEIYADDVKCAHGAAVGQIDQEELFYLQTRGINSDLGRRLLTYGFAEEVIGKIKVDSLRMQLDEAVLRHLHTELDT